MPVPARGPLTDQDYRRINEELARLAQLEQDIALAKQAGYACDEADAQCQYAKQRLEATKRVYFPNKP